MGLPGRLSGMGGMSAGVPKRSRCALVSMVRDVGETCSGGGEAMTNGEAGVETREGIAVRGGRKRDDRK